MEKDRKRERTFLRRFIRGLLFTPWINFIVREILKKTCRGKLRNVIKQKLPIVGVISVKLSGNQRFYLKTRGEDDYNAQMIYWEGLDFFEPEETKLFQKLLKHAGTIFDVGANTGLYTLIASLQAPASKIYAFEPLPEAFELMTQNVAINKLQNAYLNCGAVCHYDGETKFYVPITSSISVVSSMSPTYRDNCKILNVPALKLDTFVQSHGISKVDLIKIDTEGTENLVLEGARGILKKDEPILMCEVLPGKTEKSLHAILSEFKYQYFLISKGKLIKKELIIGDPTYQDKNYLFVTPQKMKEIASDIAQ